jgi:signal transduction histidine kinase
MSVDSAAGPTPNDDRLDLTARSNDARLASMAQDQPTMVAYWGPDGRNEFASTSYLARYGIGAVAMHGSYIGDVRGPEATDDGMPHVAGALRGEDQLFDRTTVLAHGAVTYSQSTYTPVWREGAVQGFFSVVTDTTARVETDAALLANVAPLSLLRERERIAADVHDKVMPQLYAANLALAGVLSLDVPLVAPRIQVALNGVDDAMIELRSAIFGLSGRARPVELASAVAAVLRQASLLLGFAPTITYAGLPDLAPQVSAELLATLIESLTNTAHHAAATEVAITVTARGDTVELLVRDDGRGIERLERSSGLANMRARAEQLGGSFSWRNGEPSGLVIDWRAPSKGPQQVPVPR